MFSCWEKAFASNEKDRNSIEMRCRAANWNGSWSGAPRAAERSWRAVKLNFWNWLSLSRKWLYVVRYFPLRRRIRKSSAKFEIFHSAQFLENVPAELITSRYGLLTVAPTRQCRWNSILFLSKIDIVASRPAALFEFHFVSFRLFIYSFFINNLKDKR